MRQRWVEVLVFTVGIVSMAVSLAFFIGPVWSTLLMATVGPVATVSYIRFLDRLERRRGTMSATTEQREV